VMFGQLDKQNILSSINTFHKECCDVRAVAVIYSLAGR
jgi:hypothetical protein